MLCGVSRVGITLTRWLLTKYLVINQLTRDASSTAPTTSRLTTMAEDLLHVGQNVQVIDPDVRAYVYSLVTAVSVLARQSTNADIF